MSRTDEPNLRLVVPFPLVAIDDSGSTWATKTIDRVDAAVHKLDAELSGYFMVLAGMYHITQVTLDGWRDAPSDRSGEPIAHLKVWLEHYKVKFPGIYFITDSDLWACDPPEEWHVIIA